MMKRLVVGTFVLGILSTGLWAQEAGKVGFRPGKELDAVLAEAKTTGKPILVFMHQPN